MKVEKALQIFLLAALLLIGGGVADTAEAANWRNMEVYNNTGYTIQRLYITAREQRNWGDDLLGNRVLYNGGHDSFRYSADYQYYEIKIVFSDGSTREWTDDHALNFRGSTMIVFSYAGNGQFRAKVD